MIISSTFSLCVLLVLITCVFNSSLLFFKNLAQTGHICSVTVEKWMFFNVILILNRYKGSRKSATWNREFYSLPEKNHLPVGQVHIQTNPSEKEQLIIELYKYIYMFIKKREYLIFRFLKLMHLIERERENLYLRFQNVRFRVFSEFLVQCYKTRFPVYDFKWSTWTGLHSFLWMSYIRSEGLIRYGPVHP